MISSQFSMAQANPQLGSKLSKITRFSKSRCQVPPPKFLNFPQAFPSQISGDYQKSNTNTITCQAYGKRTTVYETLTLLNFPPTTDQVSTPLSLFLSTHFFTLTPMGTNPNELLQNIFYRILYLILLIKYGRYNTEQQAPCVAALAHSHLYPQLQRQLSLHSPTLSSSVMVKNVLWNHSCPILQ